MHVSIHLYEWPFDHKPPYLELCISYNGCKFAYSNNKMNTAVENILLPLNLSENDLVLILEQD